MVHVIPRFKGDGVNFSWESKQVSEEEMKNIVSGMKSKGVELKKDAVQREEVEKLVTQIYNVDDRIP